MKKIAVLDNSWGDCGKGRVVHFLSKNYDWACRTQGSSNSGHVIYHKGKKYTHNLLPSVNYDYPTKSFLASGMVINLNELLTEINSFRQDFPDIGSSIYVDQDAFIITEEHVAFDKQNNKHIGSTGKGVQPAYTDKVARKGTRIYNLINDNAEIISALKNTGVTFTSLMKFREEFSNSSIIFEGAQSILLDINCGPNYPYVTSSDCTVSSIYSAGFNFIKLDKVYGCMKPYLTKVGEGVFPTEYFGSEAEKLRNLGGEFGAVTKRPRRCGALDLPALKYASIRGGIDSLIITKMDILNGEKTIKVCNSYGKELFSPADFISVNPEYIYLSGWADSKNSTETDEFINYVSNYIQMPIEYISTGVSDQDMIKVNYGLNRD